METGKTKKYLKYAIGEIILVVIGILIAIQLNDWKTTNSEQKQKQKVLLALKSEFESNLSKLDTIIYHQRKSQEANKKTINLIDSISYVSNNFVLMEAITEFTYGYGFSYGPINGALRSAISSGDIHLINNVYLIELLFSWEDLVKDSDEESQMLRNFETISSPLKDKYIQFRETWKYRLPNGKGSKHESDYIGLFKDPQFETYIQRLRFLSHEYLSELRDIRISNLEILNLIEQESKK